MKLKFGIKQALASSAVFTGIVLMLVSVDPRVRDRFSELLAGTGNVGSWGDRASFLGDRLEKLVRGPEQVLAHRARLVGPRAQGFLADRGRRSCSD